MPAMRFNPMELTLPVGALAGDRVRLKEYDDLIISPATTQAFYVQYLLPIGFDIQVVEYDQGTAPQKNWVYR